MNSRADAYDREIPVNIVDLGLVYGVPLEAAWSPCG
jgi:metal-sulfur cluster biosynthetic enzyme